MGDYKDLVYVYDKKGHQFACPADKVRDANTLTEEEKKHCLDANEVFGTERI